MLVPHLDVDVQLPKRLSDRVEFTSASKGTKGIGVYVLLFRLLKVKPGI